VTFPVERDDTDGLYWLSIDSATTPKQSFIKKDNGQELPPNKKLIWGVGAEFVYSTLTQMWKKIDFDKMNPVESVEYQLQLFEGRVYSWGDLLCKRQRLNKGGFPFVYIGLPDKSSLYFTPRGPREALPVLEGEVLGDVRHLLIDLKDLPAPILAQA
jgi:hypothetical protein